MKKTLMVIPYFLLWILYFIVTLEERNRFLMAQNRGMDCISSRDVGFLPGGTTEFAYDSSKLPKRRYTTWVEFWKSKGY